jgi:5'-nucleotidase / UDP-sugar diphosphatase
VMRAVRVSLGVLLAVSAAVVGVAGDRRTESVRLTILHTNDTHGRLLPFSYPQSVEADSTLGRMPERRDIGGIARRATLVARIRAEQRRRGIPVWLLDAGDFTDGTVFSTEYHGEADVAAMNALGYEFAAIGNHEFNESLSQTRKLLALAKHPVLCSNAIDKSTGQLLASGARVERIGPLRIGLFGLVARSTESYPAAREGVTIADEIETAKRVVADLRARADVVILVSHVGEWLDPRIAAEVPGIDVIVGGHSHSRLPSGEFVWGARDRAENAITGTVMVQAHQWGGELGRLDLLFERAPDGRWRLELYRARLLPITADIPEDRAVAAVVSKYWDPIAQKYGEVVGQAAADFVTKGDDLTEYNLVADAARATFGVDFELENMGGVRAPLPAGPITLADLVTLDPFNDTIVTFKITGRQLKEVLKRWVPPVSGLRYRVHDGQLAEASIDGQPLEDDRTYSGAANSFAAGRFLTGVAVSDSGRRRLDVLADYIRAQKTVAPMRDGRRVLSGHSRPSGF